MKPNEIFLLVALAVTSILAIWFYMKANKYTNAYNKYRGPLLSNYRELIEISAKTFPEEAVGKDLKKVAEETIDKLRDPEETFKFIDGVIAGTLSQSKDALEEAGLA